MERQKIALLGSTGSIGRQTLEIVRANPELFEITTLVCNRDWEQLARQAREFRPDSVVVCDKSFYAPLKDALADEPVKVYAGADAACQVAGGGEVDCVVNAIVGYAGLAPTIAALEAGKKLALANKESIVVAGDIVMRLSREHRAPILPVDSEHSAIFQCLSGEMSPIRRLVLTASGGPFREFTPAQMAGVSAEQAVAHPVWSMGAKISIDSATMMNKGFEVIEAHWLFGVPAERIEVAVHPQSIIHSMVEFADGAFKAQLGSPDMRLPIQYALTYPYRLPIDARPFDITRCGSLDFFEPDTVRFPCLRLAYEALARGGNSGCVINAANEVAVQAFAEGRTGFTRIPEIIERTLGAATHIPVPTIAGYRESDAEARAIARSLIETN